MGVFADCRQRALDQWKMNTNHGNEVDRHATYGCQWQGRCGSNHISLFCGITDWAENVTESLNDDRFDIHDFGDGTTASDRIISRFYDRLFIIAAELLSDLEHIVHLVDRTNPKDQTQQGIAREKISMTLPGDRYFVRAFQDFTNNVAKHKATAGHRCDHHLPRVFEDSGVMHGIRNAVTLTNCGIGKTYDHNKAATQRGCIQYPKLSLVVNGVIDAYQKLDGVLDFNDQKVATAFTGYEFPC